MYLVDTNIISAGAPGRAEASAALVAWMEARSGDLFLAAITIVEITAGIAKLRRRGGDRKAGALDDWLDALLHLYGARVLPFDLAAARVAGALSDRARGAGHTPELADVAIAATAAVRGFTILTRNVRHFAPLGISVVDPFARLPPLTPAAGTARRGPRPRSSP